MHRRGLAFWAVVVAVLVLTAVAQPAFADEANEARWTWPGIWAAIVELLATGTENPDETEFVPDMPIGG